MKKILLSFACAASLLSAHRATAQAPDITWQKTYYKIAADEFGSCIDAAKDGGYIIGATTASFCWFVKVDGSGTQQWDRYSTTGTGLTTVTSIKQASDGGYIAVGTDFAFAPDSIGNHGIRDFLVVKLKSNGEIEWRKALGGTSNEEANFVEPTADGGYIVVGYSFSSDGQVTGGVKGYCDYWVVKLDATGNILWQKTMGGGNYDYATSVAQTTDGGYIVAGYSGSKSGDVTGTHWGGSDDDAWVVKLDASGNISWQKSYGGSAEDRAYSIRQTTDGGYIVAGSTASTDGNVSGRHSGSNTDYWVLKLDGSGNLTWQKCLGGSGSGIGAGNGNDIAYSVRQTPDGGYAVAGTISAAAGNNDDITGCHGSLDYWLVKLDATGNMSWQRALGGTGSEDAKNMTLTTDGGYIMSGASTFSAGGDVSSPEFDHNHAWVVKLGGSHTAVGEVLTEQAQPVVYPNPASDRITVANITAGAKLMVTDVVGKTVYCGAAAAKTEVINTAGFAEGVYILHVEDGTTVNNIRFVVRK